MHVVHVPAPTPPMPSTASDDITIGRAWMVAEQSHPGPGCLMPIRARHGQWERCGACGPCRAYRETVVAAVGSAVARCKARRAGRGRISDVYELVPAWLRPYFGLAEGEGLKRLLGRWVKGPDGKGVFRPGEAPEQWRLTEDERAVADWELRGWRDWEIQRELTPKGMREER